MLQIGKVVEQPAIVLPQCIYIIGNKDGDDSQLPVVGQFPAPEHVAPVDALHGKHRYRRLRHEPGPERTAAVLQKRQQHRHGKRHQRHVVEQDVRDIAHQPVVGQPVHADGIPPHVARCHRCQQRRRPPAQHAAGLDLIANKSIAPSEEQVQACHHSEESHPDVECNE